MGFILILVLTALSIAGSAAFFSVYGLAQIFTGSFWPVVIMGSSLEAGKLVAASYLYRYWKSISFLSKTYYLAAVFVLMLITSAGIFGFLSMGYQQDVLPMKLNQQRIELLVDEKAEITRLKMERLTRKRQIDDDVAALPNDFITGRQRLLKSFGPELKRLEKDITAYTDRIREIILEVSKLRSTTLEQEVHTGPIIFIARVFETDVDDTTKWLILLIIFAFDPLAVMLTVGANAAIMERYPGKKVAVGEPVIVEAAVPIVEAVVGSPTDVKDDVPIEQIKQALDEFTHRDLTAAEIAQKGMLQEMLRRREVTHRVRTGHKEN